MKRMVVLDRHQQKVLLRQRRAIGGDRYDEVWNGVYVMSPAPDPEHQDLATLLSAAFVTVVGVPQHGRVQVGTNVSDRERGWEKNYRCPDVAVFLAGNPARDVGSHWFGGPDFAVEIISRNDRSRKKFRFYATVGVKELLVVDRNPWLVELYRCRDHEWELVGVSSLSEPGTLKSEVLPVSFRLVAGTARPQVVVIRQDESESWLA